MCSFYSLGMSYFTYLYIFILLNDNSLWEIFSHARDAKPIFGTVLSIPGCHRLLAACYRPCWFLQISFRIRSRRLSMDNVRNVDWSDNIFSLVENNFSWRLIQWLFIDLRRAMSRKEFISQKNYLRNLIFP